MGSAVSCGSDRAVSSSSPPDMASYEDDHNLQTSLTAAAAAAAEAENNPESGEGQHLMTILEALMGMLGTDGAGGAMKKRPASKKWLEEQEIVHPTTSEVEDELECPVCKVEYERADEVLELPCEHIFHASCVKPWFQQCNMCPLCRYEVPTDDPQYEEEKKRQEEAKRREADLEKLHTSMFG